MDGPAGVKKWRGQEPNNRGFIRESMWSIPSAMQNARQFHPIGSSCLHRVALIAGMAISEYERMAVLARLTAASASTMVVLPTGRATIIPLSRHHGKSRQPMTTVQEIEKAIEALPLADQLRLYRDLPHLIGSAPEELDWQRLAIEEFFKDDSPDDSVYDSI
jgi:hypothetical protein